MATEREGEIMYPCVWQNEKDKARWGEEEKKKDPKNILGPQRAV